MQTVKMIVEILCILIIYADTALSLTACAYNKTEKWYRISYGAAQSNTITVSDKSNEGFQLNADCINGANIGSFAGWFSFNSDTTAEYTGTSYNGRTYTISAEFSDEIMTLKVHSVDGNSESNLLGFGNAVTLSGEYSQSKPIYDYSDLVLEKVFLSDTSLADSVKGFLGENEYKTFVYDFGMSNYIYETEKNGYKIIKGNLKGIGNWCAFCSDSNGFFYGIYNDKYFTNDSIYEDNMPDFFTLN